MTKVIIAAIAFSLGYGYLLAVVYSPAYVRARAAREKADCFASGGTEWHEATQDHAHSVCVYKKGN